MILLLYSIEQNEGILNKHKMFWENKIFSWFVPQKKIWIFINVEVKINSELGLLINNTYR